MAKRSGEDAADSRDLCKRSKPLSRPACCFLAQIPIDDLEGEARKYEYLPVEVQKAIHGSGFENYSLFCEESGLCFGHFTSSSPVNACFASLEKSEVYTKWRKANGAFAFEAPPQPVVPRSAGSKGEAEGSEWPTEDVQRGGPQWQDFTGGGERTFSKKHRSCLRIRLRSVGNEAATSDRGGQALADSLSALQGALERSGLAHMEICDAPECGAVLGYVLSARNIETCVQALHADKEYVAWQVQNNIKLSLEPLRPILYLGGDRLVCRIAVVGAGWWGQGWHLPQVSRNSDSKVVAIVESNPHPRSTLNPDMLSTKELEEKYGVPVFTSIDALLEAQMNIDGVVVSCSHLAHFEVGMKALKAGWHVLMEKPMTTEPKEAVELAHCAANSPGVFMVNNSANWRQQAKRAHDLVKGGSIGKVKHVQCYMGSALLWLFDNPENVAWVKPSGSMVGNGFGWGQSSHTLAWALLVSGLQPERVFCTMGHSEKTGADMFLTAMVFCKGGATMCVQGTAAVPFKSYTESSKQIDNKIFGTEGMLTYSGDDKDPSSGDLVIQRHDLKNQRFPGFLFENYDAEGNGPESLRAFLGACVGRDVWNGADAALGRMVVLTLDAMYRSAKSGQTEELYSAHYTQA
eukprot:TRINITY_DN44101_c0_g1_i1.p1 TRINITY_DN44101_c0_g1~~TRINITY_DN44101_c0_g1_i1.p1  ORF type:complete len:632 (+),score=86.76 TRINITY_DN44101_c0_g1_i1:164-2059(+)